jgi:hypothetical protein
MFGSNGSMLNLIVPLIEWTSAIKSFSNDFDVEFTQEEIKIICGKATKHFYKI